MNDIRGWTETDDVWWVESTRFVLDNKALKDFNRTLLFDVKLVAIRSST